MALEILTSTQGGKANRAWELIGCMMLERELLGMSSKAASWIIIQTIKRETI